MFNTTSLPGATTNVSVDEIAKLIIELTQGIVTARGTIERATAIINQILGAAHQNGVQLPASSFRFSIYYHMTDMRQDSVHSALHEAGLAHGREPNANGVAEEDGVSSATSQQDGVEEEFADAREDNDQMASHGTFCVDKHLNILQGKQDSLQ